MKLVKHAFVILSVLFTILICRSDKSALEKADRLERLSKIIARPHVKMYGMGDLYPRGYAPHEIRKMYNLPHMGGKGTIALILAYHAPTSEKDLNIFSRKWNLPLCTKENFCFTQHKMVDDIVVDANWALESAMDVQWAHAIAPEARILLVEAKSAQLDDLLLAVDYARNRADVVAVSMSWGSEEFPEETEINNYFVSPYGATFFASSGDDGTFVGWPAVSPNVVGVGGTTLRIKWDNTFISETAWTGSGGGISQYEPMPFYQKVFGLNGEKRCVPDVSFNGDSETGVAVFMSLESAGYQGWYKLGGTSAGTPAWAGIKSLGLSAQNAIFYEDAMSKILYPAVFRDITEGKNGTCGVVCTAQKGYDHITGLGSPLVTVY